MSMQFFMGGLMQVSFFVVGLFGRILHELRWN
jgi:hypothetical protein